MSRAKRRLRIRSIIEYAAAAHADNKIDLSLANGNIFPLRKRRARSEEEGGEKRVGVVGWTDGAVRFPTVP